MGLVCIPDYLFVSSPGKRIAVESVWDTQQLVEDSDERPASGSSALYKGTVYIEKDD